MKLTINFFEVELQKAQSRFNKTFGSMNVCNLKTRQKVILNIVGMGLEATKIKIAKDKEVVRDEIKNFMQKKEFINKVFDIVEKDQKERR